MVVVRINCLLLTALFFRGQLLSRVGWLDGWTVALLIRGLSAPQLPGTQRTWLTWLRAAGGRAGSDRVAGNITGPGGGFHPITAHLAGSDVHLENPCRLRCSDNDKQGDRLENEINYGMTARAGQSSSIASGQQGITEPPIADLFSQL